MKGRLLGLAAGLMLATVPAADAGFLLDYGSIAAGSGRTVSGTGVAGGWEVFQIFTVPAPGWFVTTIGTDGWEVTDPLNAGITGTILPDDGFGNPDEGNPIQTENYNLSNDPFSSNWQDELFNVGLPAGNYWMRWSPGDPVQHWSAIFPGVSGPGSFSRQTSTGNIFQAGVTALRIDGTLLPAPASIGLLGLAGLGLRRRRR